MFNNKKKGKITLLALLALAICLAVGGTLAFLFDVTDVLTNVFEPGVVTTEVTETLDGAVKKDVKIKNTGNIEAYLRASIVVNWKDADGKVYGKYKPVEGVNYEMDLEETGWIKDSDGFYYWTEPVLSDDEDAQNCSTGVLINSCEMIERPADLPAEYFLSVEILGSGIQSRPEAAVMGAWPAVEVVNGILALK